MPSGTGGGVGLGTDVAVAGDNCEVVLLPIHPCGLVYAGRLELAGEDVFGTLTGVMLPRLRLLTLLL